jgi:hypothetical protein
MRLKLSWVLPLVQLPLAIFLLEWGQHSANGIQRRYDTVYAATPRLICGGINEPARVLAATSTFFDRVDHARPTIFGFTLDYVFFVIGIVIFGRAFDNFRLSDNPHATWTTTKLCLVGGPLALFGSLCFYVSLRGFLTPWRWNNQIGKIAQSALVLIWSLVLLGVPALKLAQRLRLRTAQAPG